MGEKKGSQLSIQNSYLSVLAGALTLMGLYLISLYNYPLFHSLAELFSIVVAVGIFMIAWNSRGFIDNNYLLFIGIAYLFVGSVDLFHTLAYKGMGVFQGYGTNLATQLWIGARYIESISLLAAPLFIARKLKGGWILAGYAAVVSLLLVSIFYWRIFPVSFIEGVGLTPFKVVSEYIISLILLASLVLLIKNRGAFNDVVLRLLSASIVVTIASELSFTLYVDPYGFSNLAGHFLKIVSFYLIYKAIIGTGLVDPYSLLFRELKESEEALRAGEERLRSVVQTATDAIISADSHGHIIFWNHAAEATFGYSADEVIGRPLALIMPERFREAHQNGMNRVVSTGESRLIGKTIEVAGLKKDGSEFPIELSLASWRTGEGIFFTGIVRDITQRKLAEEALRASEEKYRELFTNMDEGVALHEMIYDEGGEPVDYVIKDVNPRFESILNIERGRALGQRATSLYGTEQAPYVDVYSQVAATGAPTQFEAYFPPMEKYFSISAFSPGKDQFATLFTDVTERRRTEEEREQLANRIRLLLESTDEGIYGLNLEGHCTFINKGATEMTGYAPEEVLGRNIHELIHHHRKDGTPYLAEECPVFGAVKTGHGVRVDTEVFWRKEGTSFPVEYSAYPIVENEVIKGAVVTFTDITERKRAEELSDALNDINAAISSTLDFNEIMQRVTVESARAIGAEVAAVALKEGDFWAVKYAFGYPQEFIGTRFSSEETSFVTLAASTKRPVLISDAQSDGRVDNEAMERYGIRSILAIPIRIQGDVIGILFFGYRFTQVAFTKAQVDFASNLGTSTSFALENARLYEAKRNIADTLQSAILKVPRELPGIDFGYLYRSATEVARIGGDLYDFFELENDRIGFVIGDVSGKGLEAAAITSIVKSTIRAFAHRDSTPSHVLAEVNSAIAKQVEGGQFITAIYGTIDVASGSVIMASAGHPDPFICGPERCIQIIARRNPPLGIFPGISFESFEAKLHLGDALVLYTDGLIEAKRDGKLFGDDRVREVLDSINPAPVKEVVSALLLSAEEFSKNKLTDDIAIVGLRYLGIPERSVEMLGDVPGRSGL